MIELAFGESAAGALKLAKKMKKGDKLCGPAAIFAGNGHRRQKENDIQVWTGESMDGNPKDVAALTLALDIGDISDTGAEMTARKKVLDILFGDFPGAADEIWAANQHTLNRLREAESTREPVRMWISDSDPAELCGLYFVCRLMERTDTPIFVIRVPALIEQEDCVTCCRSTGEIPPEQLGALVKYGEEISLPQRRLYAGLWGELVHENAPLRAVVNGQLTGVPIHFYDFVLRNNLPDGDFKVASLIGKALNHMTGVGDRWLYLRIQAMVQSGELMEVAPPKNDHPYSGIMKKGPTGIY
jgi:hypothetical protein